MRKRIWTEELRIKMKEFPCLSCKVNQDCIKDKYICVDLGLYLKDHTIPNVRYSFRLGRLERQASSPCLHCFDKKFCDFKVSSCSRLYSYKNVEKFNNIEVDGVKLKYFKEKQ